MHRIANETVIVQLAMLFVAAALYTSTYTQSYSASDLAQSPMFFPHIILMLWIGLNIIALVQAFLRERSADPIASMARISAVVVATLIYTNVIGSEGFFIPSVLFALITLPVFGIRNPILVALFAVAVPGTLVLLFNRDYSDTPIWVQPY